MSADDLVRRAHAAFAVLGAVIALVVFGVLWLVGLHWLLAIVVGLAVGAGGAYFLFTGMDRRLLASFGARALDDHEQPRLVNMVDGLCVMNGFVRPDLYVIEDAAPNMTVVGRSPAASALVLTRGAIAQLGRIELEGSIAHELARMRSRAPLAEGTVATLGPIVGFVPPLRNLLIRKLLDPRTTVERDVEGVTLTRYPPGLARALEAIRLDGRHPSRSPQWAEHMWLVPPPAALGEPEFDLDARIAVLHEL